MSKNKEFKQWKLEAQRLLFEDEHGGFNISQVDESEDYWRDKFDANLTPSEAIKEAIEDAIDCQ